MERLSNDQSSCNDAETASHQAVKSDSCKNVLKDQGNSLADDSFPNPVRVIHVRSYDDTPEEATSGDDCTESNNRNDKGKFTQQCNSVHDKGFAENSHDSSTCFSNPNQDKTSGYELVHTENVSDKSTDAVKTTSDSFPDSDKGIVIDIESPLHRTSEKENGGDFQDKSKWVSLTAYDSEAIEDSPVAVQLSRKSVENVTNVDIDPRHESEGDISCNGYLDNDKKLTQLQIEDCVKYDNGLDSSVGAGAVSPAPESRTDDVGCGNSDSVAYDSCLSGDHNIRASSSGGRLDHVDDTDDTDDGDNDDDDDGDDTDASSCVSGGDLECTYAGSCEGEEADTGHFDSQDGDLGVSVVRDDKVSYGYNSCFPVNIGEGGGDGIDVASRGHDCNFIKDHYSEGDDEDDDDDYESHEPAYRAEDESNNDDDKLDAEDYVDVEVNNGTHSELHEAAGSPEKDNCALIVENGQSSEGRLTLPYGHIFK